MIRNEFIKFNDSLYLIMEKFHEEKIRIDKVQELRELLKRDIVLKNNNILYYCNIVSEAEIVSEIVE